MVALPLCLSLGRVGLPHEPPVPEAVEEGRPHRPRLWGAADDTGAGSCSALYGPIGLSIDVCSSPHAMTRTYSVWLTPLRAIHGLV
jgi:hypothetical protein